LNGSEEKGEIHGNRPDVRSLGIQTLSRCYGILVRKGVARVK